uniref:Uncharacterized protein n=1 Tax=Arion vulgaris TaxID=1028688 RepID=A0A0B7ACB1_9EUPU
MQALTNYTFITERKIKPKTSWCCHGTIDMKQEAAEFVHNSKLVSTNVSSLWVDVPIGAQCLSST